MTGEFGPRSFQKCQDVLCFGDVSPEAEDDWAALVEDAVGFTERKAEKTGIKKELDEDEDGELDERHFSFARKIWEGLEGAVAV